MDPHALLNRQSRVLAILRILDSGATITVDDLADRFQVCRRTVFRDVQMIRCIGVSVAYDPHLAAYRLDGPISEQLYPPPLGEDDLLRVSLALQVSPLRAAPDFGNLLERFMDGLLSTATLRTRHEVDRLLKAWPPQLPTWLAGESSEHFSKLMDAVRSRRVVRVAHSDGELRLATHQLLVHDASCWIIGRILPALTFAALRLSDVEDVEITSQNFSLPRSKSAVEQFLQQWLSTAGS